MDRGISSDEPTRLSTIIEPLFGEQEKDWSVRLDNRARAELLAGADAQDDCAIFRLAGEQELVMGSDYVRGPKFRLYELGLIDDYDIGYYLAMANFSDIAAMGAAPIALLSVVRYPREMPDVEFEVVMRGIADACAEVGAPNVGGDIGTAERLILSASAVGVVEPGRSLRRDGARPGDRLCVTGPTGMAAAAQRYFGATAQPAGRETKSLPPAAERRLLDAWKRPRALIPQGRLLSGSGVVTSCQDTSDGLKAGIESIGRLSGVGFEVDELALAVDGDVAEVAALTGADTTALMLGDSVDFQLVFTVPERDVDPLRGLFRSHGLDFYPIGVATQTREVVLRRADGEVVALPGAAWRHAG